MKLRTETWEFLTALPVSKSFQFLSLTSGSPLHYLQCSFFLLSEESQGVVLFCLGSQTQLHLHKTLAGFRLYTFKRHQPDPASDTMLSKDSGWSEAPRPPHSDKTLGLPTPFMGSYYSQQCLAIATKLL